jgi:PAS domain S-box-containing protein
MAVLLTLLGHIVISQTWHTISSAPYTVYLAIVIASALYGGLGPGVLATLLCSADLDFNFMLPYGSFAVDFDDFLYLSAFFSICCLISFLQGRRQRAEASLRAAHEDLEQRVIERTAELERSREQFSLLVNGVHDQAFFMLDAAGNIASWNSGAEKLLGFCENQIIGRPLTDIWPDSSRVQPLPGSSNSPEHDDRYEYNDWIVRKDGSRFWGCVFFTQIQDDFGRPRGRAVAVRDITERKSLERDILEISEREHIRIGHDLHDGLGQELTGAAMLSTALAERLAANTLSGAQDAENIADLIHESIRHTRDLARGLCPLDLEDDGLPAALRQLTDRLARLPWLKCIFESPHHVNVDAAISAHLYRIAQEAITNAVRHGKPTQLIVRLTKSPNRLTLLVADDGVGIPTPQFSQGMGLRLMHYRAKMIHAQLDLQRAQPRGTIVSCTVELPAETPVTSHSEANS